MQQKRNITLEIYDYAGNKKCLLYDSNADLSGQAYDVMKMTQRNGWNEISFSLPSTVTTENGIEDNPRIDLLIADYRIKLVDDEGEDWFIISEPRITHDKLAKTVNVSCGHVAMTLKQKNLGLEFSDDYGNNVGTAGELLDTILEGTGWTRGRVDTFIDEFTGLEKVRSLKAPVKTGAFKLITSMCNLFDAKPIFHCVREEDEEIKTVDIIPINPFSEPEDGSLPDVTHMDGVLELHYGRNVKSISRTLNTENMVTKLYAYGSYGDKTNGYCGIDEITHREYTYTAANAIPAGTVCTFTAAPITGSVNTVRYFVATDAIPAGSKLVWSRLDPASMMYIWLEGDDNTEGKAYLVGSTLEEIGHAGEAATNLGDAEEEDAQNWFSFLMDFTYYSNVGLLTDGMLQRIAQYQRHAPEAMEEVNEAATNFAESQTKLSEVVGSVDFVKLAVASTNAGTSHPYLQITLDKSEYEDGVIYRTDYTAQKRKQFVWRPASALLPNGDPKEDVASMVYLIHSTDPVTWDTAYLKAKDREEDPNVLTFWCSPSAYQPGDRVYLFHTNNLNGYLGALQIAVESVESSLENSTKVVTVKHPVYFTDTAPSLPVMASITNIATGATEVSQGWAWWWKSYNDNRDSEMYFAHTGIDGAQSWHYVVRTDATPSPVSGWYWYNWAKNTLWYCENGQWVQKTSTENKEYERLESTFGTVWNSCMSRERYMKGEYQVYVHTVGEEGLPVGNYAFASTYGLYRIFTTTQALTEGDTLELNTSDGVIYQTHNGVQSTLELKTVRTDSVTYFPENNIAAATWESENGSINEHGNDVERTNWSRTGIIRVYEGVTYLCVSNEQGSAVLAPATDPDTLMPGGSFQFGGVQPADVTVYFYNAKGRMTSYRALSGEFVVPLGVKYVRLTANCSPQDLNALTMQAKAFEEAIATDEQTYYVLWHEPDPDSLLKGIIPLTQKFADLADETYITYYGLMKARQTYLDGLNNNMTHSLGDILREGYWQKNDYVDGDEQRLYTDALDNLKKIAQPDTTYNVDFLDLFGSDVARASNEYPYISLGGIESRLTWADINANTAVHLVDPVLKVNCWAFIDQLKKCYDVPRKTSLSINTNLTTMTQHSFSDVMAHIAEVANEIKGKTTLYDRAAVLNKDSLLAQNLEGTIDANTLMITGGSSTWETDDQGNMIFTAADGQSAMTLTGAGFAIANSKDENGNWNWRTFGTGDGFTADLIVAGKISSEIVITDQLMSTLGTGLVFDDNGSIHAIVGEVEGHVVEVEESNNKLAVTVAQQGETLKQLVFNDQGLTIWGDADKKGVHTRIDENGMYIEVGEQRPAYFTSEDMFIKRARVTDEFSIGTADDGWYDMLIAGEGVGWKWREKNNVVRIVRQPQDYVYNNSTGENASFTVKALNATSYLWQYRANGYTAWSNANGITGASGTESATMTCPVNATTKAYTYRCRVSGLDANGNSKTIITAAAEMV